MNFTNDINKCIDTLNRGGIILYPTDTIWGIGCDATNEAAVAKVYALKQRNEKKSMIILIADGRKISDYAKAPSELIKNKLINSSKPTTVIYPKAKNLPANLINEDGTIAIRIVNDKFCKELINAFSKPIVSTSANISGEISPSGFKDVSVQIKNGVDYIVQHRSEENIVSSPSRILKWNGDDDLIVIRD